MMSETDDTDYLLLIPPDFFVVNLSESESPNDYDISFEKDSGIGTTVNFLSHRVHDRLSLMENTSPRRLDDFHDKSFNSLNYSNDLSTSNCDLFSDKKISEKLCNTWPLKIEEFQSSLNERLKNCDLLQAKTSTPNFMHKGRLANGLNQQLTHNVETNKNNPKSSKFNLYQVDKLLSEMEKTRNEIKTKLQSNKDQINLMKDHFFKKINESGKKYATQIETTPALDGMKNGANNVNSALNASLSNQTKFTELLSFPRQPKNMLSISKVMSDMNNVETLQQKLEAETLKRKHCEELIQQLQLNILEQEQNLTVALRVDAEKEEFIEQLQNGWAQLVDHWKELENQRQELASMLDHERTEARTSAEISSKKIEDLENRLRETYNLVAEYEEKNKDLEKSFKELQHSFEAIKTEFDIKVTNVEQNAKRLEKEKLDISEQLNYANENLLNERQKCHSLESRVNDLEKLTSSLNREKQNLLETLQEEKKTADALKNEVAKLKLNYNLASTAEAATTKEMNKLKQEMVKIKNTFREYYQKQLDQVLKEKVEEFQKQIQNAEKIMHQELHKQEKLVNDKFQNEITRLQNAHKIELSEERRINLKHVNILKAELRESRKKIQELEEKLRPDSSSRIEFSKRMQSNIENQWLDVLNSSAGDRSKDLRSPNPNEKYLLTEETSFNEDNLSEIDKSTFDLRRYIEMLLEKKPGKPTECDHFKQFSSQNVDDIVGQATYEIQKHLNNGKKPPWK